MTKRQKRQRARIIKHSLAQRAHAKRRVAERLGVQLNRKDYREIVDAVRSGRVLAWRRMNHTRCFFRMRIAERDCLILYDKRLHNVVTIITEGPMFDAAFPKEP
jgi:hypothetical protein